MVNSWFVIYSMVMYLLVSDVKSYVLNNDLLIRDYENDDVEQLDIVPSQSSRKDNNTVGAKKVVKIVTNPVSDDGVDVNPSSYIDTGSSNVLAVADRTLVTSRRRNYPTNLTFERIRAMLRRLVKFFICNIFASPVVCTVINVLSDEEAGGLNTPEGVARGLRFIEDIIEIYHTTQKRSI